jgi:hypothetical protein
MGQHRSPLSCLTHILRPEGISGLCRGYLPTLCRELPGNAIFFTTYEGLRRALPGRGAAAGAFGSDGASGSSRSAFAAAWHLAVDAGGAIFCGAAAGVVVSCRAAHGVVQECLPCMSSAGTAVVLLHTQISLASSACCVACSSLC